jgi:glycosyltransferase involved in cell wall biosynthesis
MNPAVSVVLPVHNGMPYIGESVRSILTQSFADFELVIGDDGSSDGTTELLRSFAEEDPRIRLLRRERPSGLAASANWVIGESRAPLVAIAHADDRSYAGRLQRQLEVLRAEPGVDLVGTLWDGIDEDGQRVRDGDYWRLLWRSRFAPFSHSSVMFRRSAFERAGGYRAEAEYWEDLDLFYRIARAGRIAVIPEVLSTVRHARISKRLQHQQERVERAVDRMLRSSRAFTLGEDHSRAWLVHGPAKLHPRTFVSCGTTLLWSGRKPDMLARLLTRGRLRPNAASAHALLWVLWATASPRSLRAFLRAVTAVRNRIARPVLAGRDFIDWSFRSKRHPPGIARQLRAGNG